MPPAKRTFSRNQPGGFAGLDADGKLSITVVPDGIGGGSVGGNIDGGEPGTTYGGSASVDGGAP